MSDLTIVVAVAAVVAGVVVVVAVDVVAVAVAAVVAVAVAAVVDLLSRALLLSWSDCSDIDIAIG